MNYENQLLVLKCLVSLDFTEKKMFSLAFSFGGD